MFKALHKVLPAFLVGLLLAGCDDGSNSDTTDEKARTLSEKVQNEISAFKEVGTSQVQALEQKADALKAEAAEHTQNLKEEALKHTEALEGSLSDRAQSLLDSAKQQVEAFKPGESSETLQADGKNDAPEKSEKTP